VAELTELEVKQIAVASALAAVRSWSEKHPRPSQVNQVQAAEMLGLSQPTVSRMVRAGLLKLNRCGLIPIGEIDRALAAD
jgi:predicted XRE-type DNA-binding protein